jgi:hypothetical protein
MFMYILNHRIYCTVHPESSHPLIGPSRPNILSHQILKLSHHFSILSHRIPHNESPHLHSEYHIHTLSHHILILSSEHPNPILSSTSPYWVTDHWPHPHTEPLIHCIRLSA